MTGAFIPVALTVDGANFTRECMQLMQVPIDKGENPQM